MEKNFPLGQIVSSNSGHDKGCYYIIVGEDKDKVLLADGKYKLLSKPKKKNTIHLNYLNSQDTEIATKLKNGQKINDQMIYHTLYEYQKLSKEDK